ncbi:hypothetical protein XAC3608_1450140 [Xanthomonas citri pv. citri]|nr:hypothetical protein XAC3608_1450140 [Xanthomonas citri pv. citri]
MRCMVPRNATIDAIGDGTANVLFAGQHGPACTPRHAHASAPARVTENSWKNGARLGLSRLVDG